MKSKSLVTLALLGVVGVSSAASAQITTSVVPPRDSARRARVVQAADSARRADSASVVSRMKEMKAWVDSAAVAIAASPSVPPTDGAADAAAARDSQVVTDTVQAARTPPRMPPDSLADSLAQQQPPVQSPQDTTADTTTVVEVTEEVNGHVAPERRGLRGGRRAPDTATPLPLLLVLSAASLLTGAMLRRRAR